MNTERGPDSRLPEDAEYWERLAARSIDAAFRSPAAAPRGSAATHPRGSAVGPRHGFGGRARGVAAIEPWWSALSDAAFVLAASALLAVVGGSLLLQERSAAPMVEGHALTSALAPDDPLLATLLNAPAAPTASALLKLVAVREEER